MISSKEANILSNKSIPTINKCISTIINTSIKLNATKGSTSANFNVAGLTKNTSNLNKKHVDKLKKLGYKVTFNTCITEVETMLVEWGASIGCPSPLRNLANNSYKDNI